MNKHTMSLPTKTAVALWIAEICGQISDGMWENSRPFDHWKFWCDIQVVVAADGMAAFSWCKDAKHYWVKKKSYALTRLLSKDIGLVPRMLGYGRMVLAGADPHDRETVSAGEYMPATLEEWKKCKDTDKWQYDFVAKYMDRIDHSMAQSFYEASYTLKDLKADMAHIKLAMSLAHE